jgi:hypothetical protein
MNLRVGRKNPHNLYLQVGSEPADTDPCVGFILDPEDASLICDGLASPWHLNEIKINAEARAESAR